MRADRRLELKATKGRPVTISLPVNRTTGFSWELESADAGIQHRELPYERRGRAIGAGGAQQFEITCPESGQYEVRFQLRRPWETEPREARTYRITAE